MAGTWIPAQLQKVLKLIEFEKGRAPGGKVITLLYVHGWKNNADEVPPGEKAKEVEKFKSAMMEPGYRSREAAPDSPAQSVVCRIDVQHEIDPRTIGARGGGYRHSHREGSRRHLESELC